MEKTKYVLEGYVTLDPFLVEWFGVSEAHQVRKTKPKEEEGNQETRQGVSDEGYEFAVRYIAKLRRNGIVPSQKEEALLTNKVARKQWHSAMCKASLNGTYERFRMV